MLHQSSDSREPEPPRSVERWDGRCRQCGNGRHRAAAALVCRPLRWPGIHQSLARLPFGLGATLT